MTMISNNWGELLEPGLRKVFFEAFDEIPETRTQLFSTLTSNKAKEYDLGTIPFGEVPEFTGTIEYDDVYQGYKTSYEHTEFAKGVKIQRKLLDDDMYSIINRATSALGIAFARKREVDAASLFNNAFNTNTFTGGDSLPLCHGSHANNYSSSTQSNLGTTALSAAALRTAYLAMIAYTDDRGNKINVSPDTLLVPPALEETAWEIIKTPEGYNTEYLNKNINYGGYRLITWKYLTDTNNWFQSRPTSVMEIN